MGRFLTFLFTHRPLCEVTELFPREAMNQLFIREIEQADARTLNPQARADLESLRGMDFVGYIDKALRNAGIPDVDRDEAVQRIVVKLLITPGGLFRNWDGVGPMSARLKRSVSNASITIGERRSKMRKRTRELTPDLPARGSSSREDLIHDFREWLRLRYGEPAVRVFDTRVNGEDIKTLIGSEDIPSNYALKKIVQQIKAGAVSWTRSDPELNFLVHRLLGEEELTLAKRFGRKPIPVG